MFKDHILKSTILTFASEESSEEVHRLVLKVQHESKWMKLVYKMLKAAEEEESFGVSIAKEFFLDDDSSPTYIWVCTFWGDKDEAFKICGPMLARRFGPPTPPKSVAIGAKAVKPALKNMKVNHEPGGVTSVTIPLPHRRGTRDKSPDTVVKVGEFHKGLKASVQGIK